MAQVKIEVHGHRGARGLMPENTIPSFLEAIKYNVDALELDVVITKDREVLVSHEPYMRSAICKDVNGDKQSNNIYNMTLAEVQQFDCGCMGHDKFPDQQKMSAVKPTLLEVFQAVEEHCIKTGDKRPKFNIEVKSETADYGKFQPEPKEFVQLVYDVIQKGGQMKNVLVQSFDVKILQELHELDASIPQALLVANGKSVAKNLKKLGYTPHAYNPYFKLVTKRTVKRCREFEMKLIPWTVNKKDKMDELIEMGVDGIITDFPNKLAKK